MDAELRELERAVEAAPSDLDLLRKLARASERIGWKHGGKTLQEWLDATLRAPYPDGHHFGPPDARSLRPLGPRVVPALLDALTGDEQRERWNACCYLGYLGAAARPSVGALLEASRSDDEVMANCACWALRTLGEEAKPSLVSALAGDPAHPGALESLALMGRAAADVADRIQALGQARSGELSEHYKAALRELRGDLHETEDGILLDLTWTFGTGREEDREFFDWRIWVDQVDLALAFAKPSRIHWRPARCLAPAKIVVHHEGHDDELEYQIHSTDGGLLTAGELMFQLHNAAQDECANSDHRYFEGLERSEEDGANRPHYELCVGS